VRPHSAAGYVRPKVRLEGNQAKSTGRVTRAWQPPGNNGANAVNKPSPGLKGRLGKPDEPVKP